MDNCGIEDLIFNILTSDERRDIYPNRFLGSYLPLIQIYPKSTENNLPLIVKSSVVLLFIYNTPLFIRIPANILKNSIFSFLKKNPNFLTNQNLNFPLHFPKKR